MKQTKLWMAVWCAGALWMAYQPQAWGSEWDRRTDITLSGPVEIPGKVLAPGTYVFKLMDDSTNRNIVQIWNEDQTRLETLILAVPTYRLNPPAIPIVEFGENAPAAPPPIKGWVFPGAEFGWEFVFPRSQAVKIAKASNQNILSTTETSQDPNMLGNAKVTAVTPEGKDADIGTALKPNSQTQPEGGDSTGQGR
jgi:hypothetical protein